MSREAGVESVVGGIVNEYRFVGFYKEKKLVPVYKADGKPLINPGLQRKLSLRIDRCIERIVRCVHVVRQNGRGDFYIVPIVVPERIRELLAVEPDLPRQQSIVLQRSPVELRYRGIVIPRQGCKRERAVVI